MIAVVLHLHAVRREGIEVRDRGIEPEFRRGIRLQLQHLLDQGKQIAVPKCVVREGRNTLDFYWIEGLEDCIPSRFELLEPVAQPSRKAALSELELMIVPVVGFDWRKNRIGYGKGYYDSVLDTFPGLKVGLAYTMQRVADFEPEAFDVPLDMIITEQGSL